MDENRSLLELAKGAGARLADAERQVLLAKAEYHTAIRRLHLSGAPLRDIAQALSLSHQRVHQVVSAAGGSWWRVLRRRRTAPDVVCTWCGRPPSEVAKLIAGPDIYICDACIESAERDMSAAENQDGTRRVRKRLRQTCGFCRKPATGERSIVAGPANVCSDCLRICREILDSRTG